MSLFIYRIILLHPLNFHWRFPRSWSRIALSNASRHGSQGSNALGDPLIHRTWVGQTARLPFRKSWVQIGNINIGVDPDLSENRLVLLWLWFRHIFFPTLSDRFSDRLFSAVLATFFVQSFRTCFPTSLLSAKTWKTQNRLQQSCETVAQFVHKTVRFSDPFFSDSFPTLCLPIFYGNRHDHILRHHTYSKAPLTNLLGPQIFHRRNV